MSGVRVEEVKMAIFNAAVCHFRYLTISIRTASLELLVLHLEHQEPRSALNDTKCNLITETLFPSMN